MSNNFLERWHDSALEPPPAGAREELETREVERIVRSLAVVILAGTIPRRLGGDVDDSQLALDRKRARRTGHALTQALRGWTKKQPKLPLDDAIRIEGAQLDWTKWQEAHTTKIRNELRCLATWAVRHEERAWGRSAVVRLENELKWVEFALRD